MLRTLLEARLWSKLLGVVVNEFAKVLPSWKFRPCGDSDSRQGRTYIMCQVLYKAAFSMYVIPAGSCFKQRLAAAHFSILLSCGITHKYHILQPYWTSSRWFCLYACAHTVYSNKICYCVFLSLKVLYVLHHPFQISALPGASLVLSVGKSYSALHAAGLVLRLHF